MRSQNWCAPKRAPRRAAERRIELAHLELAERLDVGEIGHVEGRDAGMRPAAARLFLARALRLVLLVDRERDAPAADGAGTGITVCVGSGNSG